MTRPTAGTTDVNGYVYQVTNTEVIRIVPMIYNDRITIGRLEYDDMCYDHGWCYDKGVALIAAVVWDPDTQDEPAGFKKRATPGRRKAPHRKG